jgi:spermidine synthase
MDSSWIYEKHTENYGVSWKINDILYQEKSAIQQIMIANSEQWGRMLLLDGIVQTTENDEFMYHEMITQVAMHSHPRIKNVLIIGGGDGGAVTQIVKHPTVEHIDLVEIDGQVIETCKRYLPGLASGFNDPRTNIFVQDGINYVKSIRANYDLVIIDSSDPTGPAIGLFNRDFYESVFKALRHDGMMVVQSESPLFYKDIFHSIYQNIQSVFGKAYIYMCTIPTYISGPWTFTIGSKKYDPSEIICDKSPVEGLKYYNKAIHKAAFVLPPYINAQLKAQV